MMPRAQEVVQAMTRRHFFGKAAMGLGAAAAASLLPEQQARASGGLPGLPHFPPKAKRAIYLFMAGAPSQMDLLDYKPQMQKLFDTDLPDSIRQGQRLTTMTSGQARFPIAPSKYQFQQYGQAGAWVSELLPHTAKMVDDLAIVRTVYTEAINHDPAITYICTGHQLPGRASLGAWLSYGLGSLNEDLPAFVVMTPSWTGRKEAQALFNRLWGSGFLASRHQGVALRSSGDPVLFLSNPPGVEHRGPPAHARSHWPNSTSERSSNTGDPETQTRIEQSGDGVSHAGLRARADRHFRRASARTGDVRTGCAQARDLCRQLPCWPAAWPSAECGSSRSFIAAGTSTLTSAETCRTNAATSINPAGR